MKPFAVTFVLLLLVSIATSPVLAQEESSFRGTWSVDIDAMLESSKSDDQLMQRFQMMEARIKTTRYIFGEENITIIRDDFPTTLDWKLVQQDGALFKFEVSPSGQVIRLTIKEGNSMEFSSGAGGPRSVIPLAKVSDIDQWQPPKKFEIGMKAPAINASRWLDDAKHPIELGDGRIYLLDFWATWCRPCLTQMPHLAELQKEYGSEKLCVVGISNEAWETIEDFLPTGADSTTENSSRSGQKLMEVSKTIALGVDRDAETFRSYMVASGNRALPTTFIIGGDGFVEWVGTGEEIDEVLKKVHHGTWDRDAFAKRYAGILKAYNDFPKLQQLLQRGELEEAEKLLAELKPLADSRMLVNLEAIEQRMKAATARK